MGTNKLERENLVHVDDKGRVVLPREVRRSELYAVEVTENDEIILRPRIAVDPRGVVNKETLAVLDESMKNLAKGKVGAPIDLSGFEPEDKPSEQEASPRKKSRRR